MERRIQQCGTIAGKSSIWHAQSSLHMKEGIPGESRIICLWNLSCTRNCRSMSYVVARYRIYLSCAMMIGKFCMRCRIHSSMYITPSEDRPPPGSIWSRHSKRNWICVGLASPSIQQEFSSCFTVIRMFNGPKGASILTTRVLFLMSVVIRHCLDLILPSCFARYMSFEIVSQERIMSRTDSHTKNHMLAPSPVAANR